MGQTPSRGRQQDGDLLQQLGTGVRLVTVDSPIERAQFPFLTVPGLPASADNDTLQKTIAFHRSGHWSDIAVHDQSVRFDLSALPFKTYAELDAAVRQQIWTYTTASRSSFSLWSCNLVKTVEVDTTLLSSEAVDWLNKNATSKTASKEKALEFFKKFGTHVYEGKQKLGYVTSQKTEQESSGDGFASKFRGLCSLAARVEAPLAGVTLGGGVEAGVIIEKDIRGAAKEEVSTVESASYGNISKPQLLIREDLKPTWAVLEDSTDQKFVTFGVGLREIWARLMCDDVEACINRYWNTVRTVVPSRDPSAYTQLFSDDIERIVATMEGWKPQKHRCFTDVSEKMCYVAATIHACTGGKVDWLPRINGKVDWLPRLLCGNSFENVCQLEPVACGQQSLWSEFLRKVFSSEMRLMFRMLDWKLPGYLKEPQEETELDELFTRTDGNITGPTYLQWKTALGKHFVTFAADLIQEKLGKLWESLEEPAVQCLLIRHAVVSDAILGRCTSDKLENPVFLSGRIGFGSAPAVYSTKQIISSVYASQRIKYFFSKMVQPLSKALWLSYVASVARALTQLCHNRYPEPGFLPKNILQRGNQTELIKVAKSVLGILKENNDASHILDIASELHSRLGNKQDAKLGYREYFSFSYLHTKPNCLGDEPDFSKKQARLSEKLAKYGLHPSWK